MDSKINLKKSLKSNTAALCFRWLKQEKFDLLCSVFRLLPS